MEKLKKLITSTINPFQQRRHKDCLFNLKTGKEVTKVAETYLPNVMKEGKRQRHAFISECQEDTKRFEKPIRKVKVNNFTTANFIKSNKSKQAQKLAEAKGTRDIFGRLLFLSFQQKIDVSTVIQYPLVPEPPCFTHPNGALRDNPKSNVYKVLKGMVNTEAPQNSNAVIADGIFLIQSNPRCLNYSIFVQKIVSSVLKLTQHRADLYFAVYESPSIKDTKRKERGNEESDRAFSVGPKTKMETDMHDSLRLSCFKKEWLRFFFKEIEDQIYASIIGSKLLYIAIDNKCKKFFLC